MAPVGTEDEVSAPTLSTSHRSVNSCAWESDTHRVSIESTLLQGNGKKLWSTAATNTLSRLSNLLATMTARRRRREEREH